MTSYEAGFLTKCASSGVPEEAACYLLKLAIDYQYAKPGHDIFGRPLSAPVPTERQKADAAAAGISTPATAAPRPMSRRQTAASPLGAPDPVNPYGVRGTSTERKADLSNPAEAGVSQPAPSTGGYEPNNPFKPSSTASTHASKPTAATKTSLPGPQRGKIVGNASQATRAGNSWAQYGNDPSNPRIASMTGAGTGPQQPQQAVQSKPKATSAHVGWFNGMDQNARKKMIADNGLSVHEFNTMDKKERDAMLRNWHGAYGQQQPRQAVASSVPSGQTEPSVPASASTQPRAASAMGGTEPSFTGRSKSVTMPDGTVVTRHQRSDGTWGRRPATSITMPDGTVVSRPNVPNPYGVGG